MDLPAIKALSLSDLGWQEESRQHVGGTLVIGGWWKGPHFVGYNSGFEVVGGDLSEYATIYIPASAPKGGEVSQIVWAAHYDSYARQTYQAFVSLSESVPVAFVMHGEREADWTSLGFSSRDSLVAVTLLALSLANACEPRDYRFANFLLALAETNMMALTLLSRLLEEEGLVPGEAGILGYSKEGFAAWFASAVDDRLVVAAPGGWHLENIVQGFTAMEENWGCEASIGGGVGGPVLFAFRNWLEGARGGQRALDYFSVDRFAPDLLPEFFLLHGDVGLEDMHDGIYYTPGAETLFLSTFTARPFRYDRKPDHDIRESDEARNERLTAILAHYLVTRDAAAFPKVEDSRLESDGHRFRAFARVAAEPGSVRLWWSHSPNRAFDDLGNAPWVAVPMAWEEDSWVSPWLDMPVGETVGYHIEAERSVSWQGRELVIRDASPQSFWGGLPPLSCPGVGVPDCTVFLRGDSNGDGRFDISDAMTVLGLLFLGEPETILCEDAADAEDDGALLITDAVYILNYLFLGGPALPGPRDGCATDPTTDPLGCEAYAPCGG